ncbi:MAG: SPOR domain-containing protein [Aeromonadaceae bacterium]
MNRDYVRSSKPQRKRKTAARSNAKRPTRAPFPVLRALLAVALVLGFALFLYFIKGTAEEPTTEQIEPPKAKPVPIEEQRPAKEKFDYMTLLENKEVNVELPSGATPTDLSIDPEQRKRLQAQQQLLEQARLKAQQQSGAPSSGSTATGSNRSVTASAPTMSEPERAAALLAGQIVPFSEVDKPTTRSKPEVKPQASEAGRSYLMQCGAFRGSEQAESMKLRLSFQGQSAQVQKAQSNTGTWYKVQLGPFASRAEAEQKKAALQAKHIVENCTIWMK